MRMRSGRRTLGLFLGPICFLICLVGPGPETLSWEARAVGASAVLMAIWWITEAIPIPATALLPIALFPFLGVMAASDVTVNYANHLIYLYLGGFLIAAAIERWNLHRRIALNTIRAVGVSPNRITLGFMLATAFLSMWISNTATTMMMLPIALAVVNQAWILMPRRAEGDAEPDIRRFRFGTGLMLGVAYAASIGGVATLIGTPPNAILVGVVERTYGRTISFAAWIEVGGPLAAVLLVVAWLYLTRIACRSEIDVLPGGMELIRSQLRELGPISREEKWVLAVFATVAAGWILRGLVSVAGLELVQDSTIAVAGALLLFLIPSDLRRGVFLLDWKTASRVPWDILILFGGGFALAGGFSQSGLTTWIAGGLTALQGLHPLLLIAIAALLVIFLTELTSNAATASLTLPVVAAVAEAMDLHPLGLMVTVAIAASFAFMMPVATPPNAIVFSSRYITIPQMARVGLGLNLLGFALLLLTIAVWLPWAWGLELGRFPLEFRR
jgi:solute carrier family 13 (sodium-dependent dicarboxylate transporter), member 2/3/5